jgi:hypothetical protein
MPHGLLPPPPLPRMQPAREAAAAVVDACLERGTLASTVPAPEPRSAEERRRTRWRDGWRDAGLVRPGDPAPTWRQAPVVVDHAGRQEVQFKTLTGKTLSAWLTRTEPWWLAKRQLAVAMQVEPWSITLFWSVRDSTRRAGQGGRGGGGRGVSVCTALAICSHLPPHTQTHTRPCATHEL